MATAVGQAMQTEGAEERPLPFLFFLRAAPDFGWAEVTETRLGVHAGSDWPLPWNLFRHLSAIHLVRRGLHPEVVDALLSHGDRGAESHGDHSMRIPRDDLEAARPPVNALQVDMGLRVPSGRPLLPTHLAPGHRDLPKDARRIYGARARAASRERAHDDSRRRAREEILGAMGDRPPSALKTDEWQAIGRQMLFQGDMPHPAASLRFEVFEEFLDHAWDQQRELIVLHRRFRPVPEPTPIFTPVVLAAESLLDAATRAFRGITARFDIDGARPGPILAAALGAVELVLSCRLAHQGTMLDVAHLRRNVRLIRFDGRFWLERANADLWEDGRPVLRIEVTDRAARWIGIALSATRRDVKDVGLPDSLQAWSREHASGARSLGAALQRLCELRQQVNAWQSSGAEAAHLSGRQFMAALPHHDWFRLSRLRAPTMPAEVAEPHEFMDDEEVPFAIPVGDSRQAPRDSTTAQRCATLLDGISKAFDSEATDTAALIAEIRRLTAASGFNLGDAPQVLAHFACVLLTRKRRTGKKIRLRVPTARRYWYSLVGPFVDLGHDRCLVDEDEESIREFYEDVVAWWDEHVEDNTSSPPKSGPSVDGGLTDEERKEARRYDSARRTVAQLKDFQDFAARAYGVEETDWSGIDLGAKMAVGRPALILKTEFGAALKALVGESEVAQLPDAALSSAFVLIACSHFGLRVSEAVGLCRDDWVDCEGAVVVLVRSNRIRGLKTHHSRRQVPLAEDLGPVATNVISEVLRRWDLAHKANESAALLPGVTVDTFHALKATISAALLDLLKQVTRSDSARIHGLRHSYACRLLALLVGVSPGDGLPISALATMHVRRLFLGSTTLDRRTLWTVARALGHARPSTTVRCYMHCLELLVRPLPHETTWDGSGATLGAFINLDEISQDELYGLAPTLPAIETLPEESLPLRRLRCLALVGAGYKLGRALESSRLIPAELDELVELLEQLPGHGTTGRATITDSPLLRAISAARWHELAKLVAPASSAARAPDQATGQRGPGVPVGQRRHLVLHLRHHFAVASAFVRSLGLQPTDLRLVIATELHPTKLGWIDESGLKPFVLPAAQAGKDFRLDSVEYGDPPEPVTHRASLVPSTNPTRRVQTTQELLVLWTVMHVQASAGSASTSAASKSGN